MSKTIATRFEKPHAGLKDSYRAMIAEFHAHKEPLVPFPLSFANENFDDFLARLAAYERGEHVPEGFVPHSTYWLVAGGEVVGVSNLRHRLTDSLRAEGGNIGYGVRPSARRRGHATELLRRTMDEARALGMHEVLVTCAKRNPGSVGAILRCGGVLRSEEMLASRGEIVQRYVIPT